MTTEKRFKVGDKVRVIHDSDEKQPWNGLIVTILYEASEPYDYYTQNESGSEAWFDEWELEPLEEGIQP